MTPAATTPAAKAASKKPTAASPAGTTAVPGHRRIVRPPAAPRSPRRVSGPATGRAGAATAPAPRPPSPTRRPAAPRRAPARRISGRISASRAPLGGRSLAYVRALPDHALLDRLIRGRAWIPILGVMLAGIVAMQVEVLKLGANMGRAIQRGTALQSVNEQLRASVATLADDQRIERLAAGRGMVMPPPAGVGFHSASSGTHAQQAISNIHAPSPTSFMALSTSNGAVTTAQSASPSQGSTTASSVAGAVSSASSVTSGSSIPPSSLGTPSTSTTPPSTGAPVTGSTGATAPVQPASTQTSGAGTLPASSGGAVVPNGN
jgi:hypothetical protein